MNIKNTARNLSTLVLAATMIAAPAINVFADTSDTIDTSKTASLTIKKYDITAANKAGISTADYIPNGKKNEDAEAALANYKIEGVEFTYYKAADINTISRSGKVEVMYDVDSELVSLLGLTDAFEEKYYTSNQINDALAAALTSSNTKTKDGLETYIKNKESTAMTLTDADGVTSASELPLGLYLIVETKVPENVSSTVDPFFVSLPMTDNEGSEWFYDVTVYPKNQSNPPTFTKYNRQHDDAESGKDTEYKNVSSASEGDVEDYILVVGLPEITSTSTYLTKSDFQDVLSKGLTYNKDAVIYFYDTEENAKANNVDEAIATWTDSTYFTQEYNTAEDGTSTLDVKITPEGLAEINPAYSKKWMVVAYTATLNSEAKVILGDSGNQNECTYTWSRTSSDYQDQMKSKTLVYSYGIDLTKTFDAGASEKVGDATKVQFVLYNKTDGHYIVANKDSDGVYYVTDNNKGASESEGTAFSPASSGSLQINGLEADTYVLTETQTSDGFTLLKEPITIEIKETKDEIISTESTMYDTEAQSNRATEATIVKGTEASATVDGKTSTMEADGESKNARVLMTVVNDTTFTLPATGGVGTIAFTVAGCAVAFAGVAIITKGSKKKKDEK